MSYSLNSLKGVMQGTNLGVIKGDTGSLDYSLHSLPKSAGPWSGEFFA